MKKAAKLFTFIIIGFLFFINNCNQKQSTQPENLPPKIQSLTSSPSSSSLNRLPAGGIITFLVIATDPDKDLLSYTWECTGGSFIEGQNTNTVQWKSLVNQTTTEYTITVNVSDGALVTEESLTVYVAAVVIIAYGYVEGYTYYSGTTIPVSGVSVSIEDKYSTTSSDGYYRLSDIILGNKILKASKDGYDNYQTNIDVIQDRNTKNIAMTSALYTHNLYGTVLSTITQEPLQNVNVSLLNDDGNSSQLQTTSDFNGYYQVPTVPQGQRKVSFQKQNYQTITVQIFMSNSDYQYNAQLLNKPGIPFNPAPADNATIQPFSFTLSWSCIDPNGDALKYDVFFGKSNPPNQIVSLDQTTTTLERDGLKHNTMYYWKVEAKDNFNNSTEGSIWSFFVRFPSGTVNDIDGNIYQTIKIGNQWWMAENLKVTRYRNGDVMLNVTGKTEWTNLSSGAYCYYNNNSDNAEIYGNLYNWYAANDSRNIAPTGWHIPSDTEWQILIDYIGGDAIAGGMMKESGTSHWKSPNTGATNESAFTVLPGGTRHDDGDFTNLGDRASFWSSTENSNYYAWRRHLYFDSSIVVRFNTHKGYGFSIRCVKD